jgi:hypothetical protein
MEMVSIKAIDILYMLEDDDLAHMRQSDLQKLCTVITLDAQLERERNKDPRNIFSIDLEPRKGLRTFTQIRELRLCFGN